MSYWKIHAPLRLLAALAIASASTLSHADERLVREDGDWLKTATCKGPTPGETKCDEITGPTKASDIPGLIDTLKWQYGETIPWKKPPNNKRPPEKQWSFETGGLLKGKWIIEVYAASDDDYTRKGTAYCYHGAHLSCRYERHPDDPANLDFVQMVRVSREAHGLPPETPHIDPYPDLGADDAPFYFKPGEDRDRFRHETVRGKPGILFGDSPAMAFEEATPHGGSTRFWLALASWSNDNPKKLTVHEGISWGYAGQCGLVPEPSSMTVMAVGAVAFARRRRKP